MNARSSQLHPRSHVDQLWTVVLKLVSRDQRGLDKFHSGGFGMRSFMDVEAKHGSIFQCITGKSDNADGLKAVSECIVIRHP